MVLEYGQPCFGRRKERKVVIKTTPQPLSVTSSSALQSNQVKNTPNKNHTIPATASNCSEHYPERAVALVGHGTSARRAPR